MCIMFTSIPESENGMKTMGRNILLVFLYVLYFLALCYLWLSRIRGCFSRIYRLVFHLLKKLFAVGKACLHFLIIHKSMKNNFR